MVAALKKSAQKKPKIGLLDHGRRMSLKAFEFADVAEGCIAELARGYIVVGEVPNYFHAMQVAMIMKQLWLFDERTPGIIHTILDGASSKLLMPEWESERHPDIAIYLNAPKGKKDRTLWRRWIPEIVIEVVSPSSGDRDYVEKRDEYWTLGVKEYWIVDAGRKQVLALSRGRSRWTEKFLGPSDACETKLLPGFRLPCKPNFAAGACQP